MAEANGPHKEGYEATDVKMGVIVIFAIALGTLLAGGILSMIIVVRGLEGAHRPAPITTAPPFEVEGRLFPGEPHLQQDPVAEKEALLEAARRHLSQHGLVTDEPEMKRAHIPIERAMELVASGQAPYRQAPTTAQEESKQ